MQPQCEVRYSGCQIDDSAKNSTVNGGIATMNDSRLEDERHQEWEGYGAYLNSTEDPRRQDAALKAWASRGVAVLTTGKYGAEP